MCEIIFDFEHNWHIALFSLSNLNMKLLTGKYVAIPKFDTGKILSDSIPMNLTISHFLPSLNNSAALNDFLVWLKKSDLVIN